MRGVTSTASRGRPLGRYRRIDGVQGPEGPVAAAPPPLRLKDAVVAPCALGFISSSPPMTAPAYLSPLAPSKEPSNAVGVSRVKAPRVSAFVEEASMSKGTLRTILSSRATRAALSVMSQQSLIDRCAGRAKTRIF